VVLRKAELLAMLGRLEEAWALALPAAERERELSGDAEGYWQLAEIAALAGNHPQAVAYLRRTCEMYERRGSRSHLSTTAPQLGRSLCALGRFEEAEPFARLGRDLGSEQDPITQALWRVVQALVHAQRGEHAQAERLAHEAVELSERTDSLNSQGDALCDLAEVLAAAGQTEEATNALEQALDRYERKRNLAVAGRASARLAELRSSTRA
jgi:tetratricopeptide (TPR) repeat protein